MKEQRKASVQSHVSVSWRHMFPLPRAPQNVIVANIKKEKQTTQYLSGMN